MISSLKKNQIFLKIFLFFCLIGQKLNQKFKVVTTGQKLNNKFLKGHFLQKHRTFFTFWNIGKHIYSHHCFLGSGSRPKIQTQNPIFLWDLFIYAHAYILLNDINIQLIDHSDSLLITFRNLILAKLIKFYWIHFTFFSIFDTPS